MMSVGGKMVGDEETGEFVFDGDLDGHLGEGDENEIVDEGDEGDSGDRGRLLGGGGEEEGISDEKKAVRIEWLANWLEGFWENYRSTVWVGLMAISTLTGRSLFRGKFPYPFYFIFLLQILANVIFELWAISSCLKGLRQTKLRGKEWHFGLSLLHTFIHALRLLLCSGLSTLSMILGAQVLLKYQNFHVIAILPICSYCCDSFLLHLASVAWLHPRRTPMEYFHLLTVALVSGVLAVVTFTDYRFEKRPLLLALAAFALESLSRILLTLRSNVQEQRRESKIFFIFERLVMGIPQLIITGVITFKLENTVDAYHRLKAWGLADAFWTFLPGTLLFLFFGSGFNSVYRPAADEEVFSVLEDVRPQAKDAVATTLHAGIIFTLIQTIKENTLLNWYQAIAFSVLYVVAIGPLHVGYYPQRLHNLLALAIRRKQRHTNLNSWPLFIFLLLSSLAVGISISCTMMYWTNTIAYTHNSKTFINLPRAKLDYAYRPPKIRGIDVIIAHSNGHSHSALYAQVERILRSKKITGIGPYVKIITKDPTLADKSDPSKVADYHIETLPDVGGQSATFLYYILSKWATLPTQLLFLSSQKSDGEFSERVMERIYEYFAVQGFPIADAEPKTGFLNLGDSEVCKCGDCYDSKGWVDSFGLVPSMWSATRPNVTGCESVLLTRGGNFFSSAARVRATKKDVWQLLFDGLVNQDMGNAWAHEAAKIPKMLEGEAKMGRWSEDGGVYGTKDSVEEPLLGKTVERLWGVLLQCSIPEVAWRCPSLERGWRLFGEMSDCGCIDELAPGFL